MKLILGSSSLSRRRVLETAGYTFDVVSPDIDEKAVRHDDPRQIPLLVAREKARVLRERITEPAIVIAGDQVVMCDGALREKPVSEGEACAYLRSYAAGIPAETVSALVVFSTETGKQEEGVDVARAFFRPIPEDVIQRYVATGDPLTHAGGFAFEHELLFPHLGRIQGDPDSVQGLPLKLLRELMAKVEN